MDSRGEHSYLHELHGDELESLLLEPLDDVAAEAALHAVGLDHDEGALVVAHLKKWSRKLGFRSI